MSQLRTRRGRPQAHSARTSRGQARPGRWQQTSPRDLVARGSPAERQRSSSHPRRHGFGIVAHRSSRIELLMPFQSRREWCAACADGAPLGARARQQPRQNSRTRAPHTCVIGCQVGEIKLGPGASVPFNARVELDRLESWGATRWSGVPGGYKNDFSTAAIKKVSTFTSLPPRHHDPSARLRSPKKCAEQWTCHPPRAHTQSRVQSSPPPLRENRPRRARSGIAGFQEARNRARRAHRLGIGNAAR